MAAGDTTRLVIELETILRGLNKTLRGLDQVKQRLQSIASIRVGGQPIDKAALSAQRLSVQQQRLITQSQELANRQERARQTADRLTLSQQRLTQAQQRATTTATRQADAHVQFFRAVQRASVDANKHVQFFRANEAALKKAPQLDSHVRAFRAIEKSAQDANKHVEFFRANEAFLRKSPQLDAHVTAFRSIEKATRDANREQERARRSALTLEQTLGRVGGSLRNLGLGLVSLGASLSVALTAPLTALGVLSARNAVTLDSLQRGLTAITGSADEAGRQLSRLTEIAKLPGIGFQEAIQGSIRLQAVGFSAGVAERALIQFSNAVALTGGGREELARITVQLGQLSAKGKVLAQDLKPIIEAGPAVGRALLQAFGTVNSEDIQALGLSSEQFIEKLLTQLEQLPRAAAGLRNTFDNFADAVFRASAAIGTAILPVLTRLIEIAEPIITKLADGFAKLPAPVQTLVVVFGALTAAAGPALFVLGQFATGIGGLISAFGRLHTLGLLPTIAGFKSLIPIIRGTTVALTAQQVAAAGAAASLVGLGVAAVALVALVAGLALLSSRQKDAVKISKEQIAATNEQIDSLKDQIKFVDGLNTGVERTADEQERLAKIYAELNTQAKIRLTTITDEEARLEALREELQRVLNLRNEERIQQASNLTASLANTTAEIAANKNLREGITQRVIANTELIKVLREGGRLTSEQAIALAAYGDVTSETATVVSRLERENELLVGRQDQLINSAKELNGTAKEQGEALAVLQKQTGLSARELLTAAKAMGVFKGDIEAALPAIEAYIERTRIATRVTDEFQRALDQQAQDLLKSGDAVDALIKADKALIGAASQVAKEATDSFTGARKSLEAFIAAQPRLAQAIENERRRSGKSLGEFLDDALRDKSRGRGRSGTGLRNAQEQLAKALAEGAEKSAEQLREIERLKNERLLEDNENSFRLQLISYRQYLADRARLTSANIGLEIDARRTEAELLKDEEERARARSLRAGISAAERTRAEAAATEAANKRREIETGILRLRDEQDAAQRNLTQALKESTRQQIRDIRELDIEFAELTGRIEDALNAATVEKFRERLEALGKEQKRINEELQVAKLARDADAVAQLETASRLNQSQIDLIESITQQEFATNKLAAANEFVRRVKEQQAELERQIAFEVEFRGLTEEEALQRRLEGERKLVGSLRVVRDLVQAQVDALNAQAIKPPQALIEFIRETDDAIRGLGELSFSEQFQLAEKEFNRLNDERLRRIGEVERAIRERDIAEIEGMLIIRRINGEYEGDLLRQVELLKAIAARSRDTGLQKQAADLEQTAKDANSQLADFDRQLRSASIDALKDGFTDFFTSLSDRTKTAREKLLDLVDSVAARIQQVIAENLSEKLIESLFGTGEQGGQGILASVGQLFGLGGGAKAGAEDVAKTAAGLAKTAETATATAALTTGATAAATALATGGATAGATLVASLTAAAASFSAAVVAAGTAFAAAVTAAASTQAATGLGSALGAATGLFPAVPGGAVHVLEGGYPEAILTTDPKYFPRQLEILKAYLKETQGLGGRLKAFAAGGFISPSEAQSMILGGLSVPSVSNANIGELAIAGTPSMMKLRQVLVDQRNYRDWLTSSEGEQVIVDLLHRNQPVIRKLGGKK